MEAEAAVTDKQWCVLSCGDYHHKDCPVGEKLRDCWNTPRWLTDILPPVTLDPCSNPFSTVRATRHVMLEPAEPHRPVKGSTYVTGDGLSESWKNRTVFVNGPYSNLLPWCRKAGEARAFIFLVNNVTTTKWYRELVANGGENKFEFYRRLKFEPPPRILPSTNNRDQVLICNAEGRRMIGSALTGFGRWWKIW